MPGEITHNISTGLIIPVSKSPNHMSELFISITADGTLDNGSTRANLQEGNNLTGSTDEWEDLAGLPGPFLLVSGTIVLKADNFNGAFLRIELTGAATAGILTIKTFYKR